MLKNTMMKVAATTAIAAGSIGGAVAMAGSAQAATSGPGLAWMHYSAHYSSLAQCNQTRTGVLNRINYETSPFRHYVLYAGKCNYNYAGRYWTYGHITYTAGMLGKYWSSDKLINWYG